MVGDNRSRQCGRCCKAVYDLTELSNAEVARLLSDPERLPCVRIRQQPDGRLLTADSNGGMRIGAWRFLRRRSTWLAGWFALVMLPGCHTRTLGTPTLDRIQNFPQLNDASELNTRGDGNPDAAGPTDSRSHHGPPRNAADGDGVGSSVGGLEGRAGR